ncbi:Hypothetical protein SRAE_2000133500 [Strongyloides ratti]|uniref:Uncharacterized protein n=1 Tax=Strongyloides ratti TaxID=34506 RepID=A0A090LEV0_STRRB|nr:Hypothetical protein SRAE_2000133500 [Strongyloides ratti]CEF66668.1 Hypothetical protein SRAE_2000133500 [Strongyloides ratti]
MAENYECIDDPNSGVPPPPPPPGQLSPVPPPPPPPQGAEGNPPPPPPPLNERVHQGKSSEAVPPAPRLIGNPLSDSELRKKKSSKGCCTIS